MCDGDKLLVIKDKTLTTVAKRNMEGIVPLAYELKKAKSQKINNSTMYEGMIAAYNGGNIGIVSNNISKVWNCGTIGEEQLNIIKWLCMKNNQTIDFAKTLWMSEPPADIEKLMKSYTKNKLPAFFEFAKDKSKDQVEKPNDSTMNRISKSIPSSRISYCKTISKFDYRMLMNQKEEFTVSPESKIIKTYDYWNTHQYLFNSTTEDRVNQEETYMYQQIREKVLNSTEKSLDYVINTLVAYLYTVRPNSKKKILWGSFGRELVCNLKVNTADLGKICPQCGKRFKSEKDSQVYCCENCFREARKRKSKECMADLRG